jgi:ESCRT-I complex subunit TSG101
MQTELSQLAALQQTLNSNTSILHTALRDADALISNSQHKPPPGIDEILVAPTVVGNQLYELIAEERALGDALFVLGRAVERGRVPGGVFVKSTRGLAREWFLKKALVRKIGVGMGLDI